MRTIKLMWLPDGDIFWDVVTETSTTDEVFACMSPGVSSLAKEWSEAFADLYHQWLDDADTRVSDIKADIVKRGLFVAGKVAQDTGFVCHYWFDVDRTTNPTFRWQSCPLCGIDLTVHDDWHRKNRYYCARCGLIFPLGEIKVSAH